MDLASSRLVSCWAPMFVFGAFTALEGWASPAWYPWLYLAKVTAVAATLAFYPACLRDIIPAGAVVAPAIAVGLVTFAQWVLIDRSILYPHLGVRAAFNPFTELPGGVPLAAMLAGRFFGLVVLVPIIEESFWRNFVLRYATNQNIEAVPIGTYSMTAFWITAVGSALTHPEWLVALVAAILFALLLRATRSMFAVVLAHATANLALGVYIVTTDSWQYW